MILMDNSAHYLTTCERGSNDWHWHSTDCRWGDVYLGTENGVSAQCRLIASSVLPQSGYYTIASDLTQNGDPYTMPDIDNPYVAYGTYADNDGPLMTLAAQFKDEYFGGVAPTRAQLIEYLQGKYGSGLVWFTYEALYNSALGYWEGDPGDPNKISMNCPDVEQGFNSVFTMSTEYPTTFGSSQSIPSTCQDMDAICAFLIFGDWTPSNKLQFDVYIQGASEPVIDVKWSATEQSPDFSLQLVNVTVGRYPYSYIQIQDVPLYLKPITEGVSIWEVNKFTGRQSVDNYTWSNSFHSQYITECQSIMGNYTSFENVLYYHDAEIADKLVLYLRFQQQVNEDNQGKMTYGELYSVEIPRTGITAVGNIVVTEIADSSYDPGFETTVVVHLGAPPQTPGDEGGGPPPPDPDPTPYPGGGTLPPGVVPDPFVTPTGFPGHSVLTKTYAMIESVLQNVGTKLWTQSYYDVLKVQNNPIENIISCKWFPFSLSGTPNQDIVIGDINMGIKADRIANLYRMHIGEATFTSPYNGADHFLAYSPFCQVKLHLPYIGIVELDATQIMNRTLSIDYVVDLITGDCMAIIRAKFGSVYMPVLNVGGHMGVDIPLTSSNRVQQEIKAAGTTISASLGAAAHLMGGDALGAAQNASGGFVNVAGMDYATQRTSSHSPACSSMEETDVWAEVWYVPYVESEGFKYLHGYPCHKYLKLSQVSGFTKVDTRTKIDIAMTEEENRMLEELLTTGIYV